MKHRSVNIKVKKQLKNGKWQVGNFWETLNVPLIWVVFKNIFSKCYFSLIVTIQCYISFRCITQWLDIHITYKVITLNNLVTIWPHTVTATRFTVSPLSWNISFLPFTFSLYVSFHLVYLFSTKYVRVLSYSFSHCIWP